MTLLHLQDIKNRMRQFNWLTLFALMLVAVTSGFIIHMALKLTDTLSSPDWCARAIQAEKLSGTRPSSSCIDLLAIQLKSLALDNHIYAITLAVCLAVLVVIVLAKARLDLEVSKDGGKLNVEEQGRPTPRDIAAAASGAAAGAASAVAKPKITEDDDSGNQPAS